MTAAARDKHTSSHGENWLDDADGALNAVENVYRDAIEGVRGLVSKDGKLSAGLIEREQRAMEREAAQAQREQERAAREAAAAEGGGGETP